jgi:hypothetical protein
MVALIWATPLPPLRITPHEHLASHGRAHGCIRSMPRELVNRAASARARTLQPFSSVQDLVHFPSGTRTAARCGFLGAQGPHRLLCCSSVACAGREGFSAAVDQHRGAQVGGGARLLEWVRNDDTGRPDLRPTPLPT